MFVYFTEHTRYVEIVDYLMFLGCDRIVQAIRIFQVLSTLGNNPAVLQQPQKKNNEIGNFLPYSHLNMIFSAV